MGYEVPKLEDLEDRTRNLAQLLNRQLKRCKLPEYKDLRRKVANLRKYYTEKGGNDELRIAQIKFITDIMTMLPLPGQGDDYTSRFILIGALFHRAERIEYSYDEKQQADTYSLVGSLKSWGTFFAKAVTTYKPTNSQLYNAIGMDVLNLQLDEMRGQFIIDPLMMYDCCKTLSDFVTAKIKSRSDSSSEPMEVYTKLTYICDEKGQDPETGKEVFDRGLERIINLHKENASKMTAVHYFTDFAANFSAQIKANCPDVKGLLAKLEKPIQEILGKKKVMTEGDVKEIEQQLAPLEDFMETFLQKSQEAPSAVNREYLEKLAQLRKLSQYINLFKEKLTNQEVTIDDYMEFLHDSNLLKGNKYLTEVIQLSGFELLLQDFFLRKNIITKQTCTKLLEGKGFTAEELSVLQMFIPVGEVFYSSEQESELKEKTMGVFASYQMFLISGMYFFMLDEVTERINTDKNDIISKESYLALALTLEEVLGFKPRKKEDIVDFKANTDASVLEAKCLCFTLLSKLMTDSEFSPEIDEFPKHYKPFEEKAEEFILLKKFNCLDSAIDIKAKINMSLESLKETLYPPKVQVQEHTTTGIVATL